jgi:hypothetical protein
LTYDFKFIIRHIDFDVKAIFLKMVIYANKGNAFLLISESVELLAVRAMPGNTIARKVFKIDVHTSLTDGKSTPAGPAKRGNLPATVANPVSCAAALQPHAF